MNDVIEIFINFGLIFAIITSLRQSKLIQVDEEKNKILNFITQPFWHIITFVSFLVLFSDRASNNYLFPFETIILEYNKHGLYSGIFITLALILNYFWILVGFGLSSKFPKRYVLYNLIIGLIFLVVMNEWKNYELGL